RIALMSSSFLSFLFFASPEKGDPKSGILILLILIFPACTVIFILSFLFLILLKLIQRSFDKCRNICGVAARNEISVLHHRLVKILSAGIFNILNDGFPACNPASF